MKKIAYTAPAIEVMQVQTEQLLNTISGVASTNVDGLDVSEEAYEGVSRSRKQSNVWGDEEEEEEW